MSVTRAALYVDFDNFFGGLIAGDPDAAVEVAMNPSVWLARLTREHSDDGPRRWLALRCYMNPAGWVANPRSDSDRLYFLQVPALLRPRGLRRGGLPDTGSWKERRGHPHRDRRHDGPAGPCPP